MTDEKKIKEEMREWGTDTQIEKFLKTVGKEKSKAQSKEIDRMINTLENEHSKEPENSN